MNRVAFVFQTAPHGQAAGREGLDAVLAASALSEELGVFFLGDGVYQLLQGQQPAAILGRDYAPAFKLLDLYDVADRFVCADSMAERRLTRDRLLVDAQELSASALRERLADYHVHLFF